MGQAKQRGTFDQRKAVAIERNREIANLRAADESTRPLSAKTSVTTTAMLGLIAGALMKASTP